MTLASVAKLIRQRKAAGLRLYEAGCVVPHARHTWGIIARPYVIHYRPTDGTWRCTCPDFENRGEQLGTCKHIEACRHHDARHPRPAPRDLVDADMLAHVAYTLTGEAWNVRVVRAVGKGAQMLMEPRNPLSAQQPILLPIPTEVQ